MILQTSLQLRSHWIEVHDRNTYQAILDADKRSADRLNGHGNAIAQVYNHIIMPLARRILGDNLGAIAYAHAATTKWGVGEESLILIIKAQNRSQLVNSLAEL